MFLDTFYRLKSLKITATKQFILFRTVCELWNGAWYDYPGRAIWCYTVSVKSINWN